MTHIYTETSTLKEMTTKPLNVLREGGTEHQSLAILSGWHSRWTHQATHVGLKAHIQHPVSFIQHQVTHFAQANLKKKTSSKL